MAVLISAIRKNSIAQKSGISAGERLVSINGYEIYDILDYQFYINEQKLALVIESGNQKKRTVHVEKAEYEDVGFDFCSYLMDEHKSCKNKCIFCFIDQLPKGMRESLYFKDDDSRLSFLFGNYITLTNITRHEIDRIINMRISPINVSIHTTNPDLRVKMMNNKNAGGAYSILEELAAHNIKINCQIVLCAGINDGNELKRTLKDLSRLYPALQSIAVVPVGLTKYRDGLFKLEAFDQEKAKEAIKIADRFGNDFLQNHRTRLAYMADEFFLKAGMEPPSYSYYGDFNQLENGVGLWTMLKTEFIQALKAEKAERLSNRKVSIATGTLAAPLIRKLVSLAKAEFQGLECEVYEVKNEFFGETINVAGLITGGDMLRQLKGKDLGRKLLIPDVMLRREQDVFLDDLSLEELSKALKVQVKPVSSADGYELLHELINN